MSLIVLIWLAVFEARMAPVKPGDPTAFWEVACGVDLEPDVEDYGDAYFIDARWVAYEVSMIHGSEIYIVPMSEALSKFDSVVDALEKASTQSESSPFVEGYEKWRGEPANVRKPEKLLEHIHQAQQAAALSEDIDLLAYQIAGEQEFWRRLQRADWYWANPVFEWTFLTGLALFAVWPIIRGSSLLRQAVHIALLPLLFMLPAYLGYATFTLTSAGPSGGIVYPYLLIFARHGWTTSLDERVLARLPLVLEPLSVPIGDWMALTGMGMCGPTCAICIGVVLGAAVLLVGSCRSWCRRICRWQSAT